MENKQFKSFFNEILEKYNNDLNQNSVDYEVHYIQGNDKKKDAYEIRFSIEVGRSGRLHYSIEFPLDFGSIQGFLNAKNINIDITNIENKKLFAKVLSKNFDWFLKFCESVGFFNSDKDYCNEIAEFIKPKKSLIIGGKFGM
jgi:hypothetical protein